MSQYIVLLVLVAYPLLHFLPLNIIRFRWSFKAGLAPMPPEMEAKAEAADRARRLIIHLALCAFVAWSMRAPAISLHEVGFSLNNWKSALGLGLMFSLLPAGLTELFLSKVSPEAARKEAESRGPVASWYGLTLTGSFSNEVWRAFCIVTLIRHGFPAWLAVVLPACFVATVFLQFSIAATFGAVVIGVAVGLLFVETGSLLATGSMAFICGLAYVHSVRLASGLRASSSRHFRPCPACGELIQLFQVRWAGDMITCPSCGECLTTKKKYLWAIGAVSVAIAGYATKRMIYRDSSYVLVAEALAFVLFFVLNFCFMVVVPPKLKRVEGKPFDRGVSLFGTDRANGKNKEPRT
jgi:hypothetical protein